VPAPQAGGPLLISATTAVLCPHRYPTKAIGSQTLWIVLRGSVRLALSADPGFIIKETTSNCLPHPSRPNRAGGRCRKGSRRFRCIDRSCWLIRHPTSSPIQPSFWIERGLRPLWRNHFALRTSPALSSHLAA
jgi:hypothetical protein